MSVPSFWPRYTATSARPSDASAASKLSAIVRATSYSAAFRMDAFSRSRKPSDPISDDSVMGKPSPSSSRRTAAARFSCASDTGENTLVTATDSKPSSRTTRATSRISSSDSALISRPSNSLPPCTRKSRTRMAFFSSSGQSAMQLMAVVAGAPTRSAATLFRRLRSTMAFVQCVVPSMANPMLRAASAPIWVITSCMAATMPLMTSSVVGLFVAATSLRSPSMTTASVFVPPTSIPRRQMRF